MSTFTASQAAQQNNRDHGGKYQAKVNADPTMRYPQPPKPYTTWPLHSIHDGKLSVNGTTYKFDEKTAETRSQAENLLWAPNPRGKQKARVVHLDAFRGRQSSLAPLKVVAPDDGAPMVILPTMPHQLHVVSGNVIIDATNAKGGSVIVDEGATCEIRVAGTSKYKVGNNGGDLSVHADSQTRVFLAHYNDTNGTSMLYGGGSGCTIDEKAQFMTDNSTHVNIYQRGRVIEATG